MAVTSLNHSALLSAKTMGRVLLMAAAKHNLREIPALSVDPVRTVENVVLQGPKNASEMGVTLERKMRATGLNLDKFRARKNGTMAAEILFGLPASTQLDTPAYFRACTDWVSTTFGPEVTLSAVVHVDETNPHCHVLMLPMRDGQWRASKVFGKKADMFALQAQFFRDVAAAFGVQPPGARMTAAGKTALTKKVMCHLKDVVDPVFKSEVWPVVRTAISTNPRPWAEQLGIPMPDCNNAKRMKTMAQIFTGTGKGPKTSIADFQRSASDRLPSVLVDF